MLASESRRFRRSIGFEWHSVYLTNSGRESQLLFHQLITTVKLNSVSASPAAENNSNYVIFPSRYQNTSTAYGLYVAHSPFSVCVWCIFQIYRSSQMRFTTNSHHEYVALEFVIHANVFEHWVGFLVFHFLYRNKRYSIFVVSSSAWALGASKCSANLSMTMSFVEWPTEEMTLQHSVRFSSTPTPSAVMLKRVYLQNQFINHRHGHHCVANESKQNVNPLLNVKTWMFYPTGSASSNGPQPRPSIKLQENKK